MPALQQAQIGEIKHLTVQQVAGGEIVGSAHEKKWLGSLETLRKSHPIELTADLLFNVVPSGLAVLGILQDREKGKLDPFGAPVGRCSYPQLPKGAVDLTKWGVRLAVLADDPPAERGQDSDQRIGKGKAAVQALQCESEVFAFDIVIKSAVLFPRGQQVLPQAQL